MIGRVTSFTTDQFEIDKAVLIAKTWLNQNFYYRPGYFPEWAYKNIKPAILIEELLKDEHESLPADFKFFMINGKCEFIQVDTSRFQDHRRDLFTAEWLPMNVSYKFPRSGIELPKPKRLDELNWVAEKLSEGTDFIRVDLYDTPKGIKVR